MYSQIKKSKNLKPKIANQKKNCKNQTAKNLHKNYGKIGNIKWRKKKAYKLSQIPHFRTNMYPKFCF